MSTRLWDQLPARCLKMGFERFARLDRAIQQLLYKLALKQRFKCALCSSTRGLVVEHDHEPEEGPSKPYTIYNVRGLVCGSCNWHLGFYECEARGGFFCWENASCRISDSEYESYIYLYRCRVGPLIEALQEQRMGSDNYWRMRRHHQRFDEWYYEGARCAWRDRLAEERARTIRTPEQFIRVFTACVNFVGEQIKKDPDFQPPEKFMKVFHQVRGLVEAARAGDHPLEAQAASVGTPT
jgi:hypothetical protein